MTYRLKNISIAIALALVAALLATFYVTNYQRSVRHDEANVQVFVAARDIPAGTDGADVVAKGMLTKADVVRRSVVPGSISDPAQIDELVATQPIFAGEQVTTRRFATPAERGIRAQLTGTMRAIQVAGDQHQILAGTLRAGDRVDVIASVKVDGDKEIHATRIVLRDIEVLKAPAGASAETKLGGLNAGLSVLLAVTDTQVQKLFHVLKHGDWSLELRPPVKASDSPETVILVGSILRDGLRRGQLDQLESGGGTR